jgi:hypothetical protein
MQPEPSGGVLFVHVGSKVNALLLHVRTRPLFPGCDHTYPQGSVCDLSSHLGADVDFDYLVYPCSLSGAYLDQGTFKV